MVARGISFRRVSIAVSKIEIVQRYYSSKSKIIHLDKEAEKETKLITDKFSTLRDKYNAPKYPIVLCHGFSGFDTLKFFPISKDVASSLKKTGEKVEEVIDNSLIELDYWHGIRDCLEKLGSTVLTARVPPFGSIEERAKKLNEFITEQCKIIRSKESKSSVYNQKNPDYNSSRKDNYTLESTDDLVKVNLISHSMGGLDSRYLISKLKHTNYQIVSLTTIATPHHGSEFADFLIELIKNEKNLPPFCRDSISELTTYNLEKFNKKILDDKNVAYFSYGARFFPRWYNLFKFSWKIIKRRNFHDSKDTYRSSVGDNDGMVSVESSKWGKYLGTLDQVDHLDLINWTNRIRALAHEVAFNEKPKFNAVALYLDIADNLSKKGF